MSYDVITTYVMVDSDGTPVGITYSENDKAWALEIVKNRNDAGMPTALVAETWRYVDDGDELVFTPDGSDEWPVGDPVYTR